MVDLDITGFFGFTGFPGFLDLLVFWVLLVFTSFLGFTGFAGIGFITFTGSLAANEELEEKKKIQETQNLGDSKSVKPKIQETQNPGNSKSGKLEIRETQNPGHFRPTLGTCCKEEKRNASHLDLLAPPQVKKQFWYFPSWQVPPNFYTKTCTYILNLIYA